MVKRIYGKGKFWVWSGTKSDWVMNNESDDDDDDDDDDELVRERWYGSDRVARSSSMKWKCFYKNSCLLSASLTRCECFLHITASVRLFLCFFILQLRRFYSYLCPFNPARSCNILNKISSLSSMLLISVLCVFLCAFSVFRFVFLLCLLCWFNCHSCLFNPAVKPQYPQ